MGRKERYFLLSDSSWLFPGEQPKPSMIAYGSVKGIPGLFIGFRRCLQKLLEGRAHIL
jgi:hypothetical protein